MASQPPISRRRDERRIAGVMWHRIGRRQHTYRGRKTSYIWDHGDLYIKAQDPEAQEYWVCDHCDDSCRCQKNHSTANPRRHLIDMHGILDPSAPAAQNEDSESIRSSTIAGSQAQAQIPVQSTYSQLYNSVNIDKFRGLLLRTFVYCQLSFNLINQVEFRELLKYLHPNIERHLIHRQQLQNWIIDEYEHGREVIKLILQSTLSKIHISFDVWTAPNGTPILGICGHFLDTSLKLRHPLLALRVLSGRHTGEALAEILAGILKDFEIVDKWGVTVSDNTTTNDTCVRTLVAEFHPTEGPESRRSRCFNHVINLAAQAFIYGRKHEGFIVNEEEEVVELSERDQQAVEIEMARWRKRGSFGKFHNICRWMGASYIRSQRFKSYINMVLTRRQDGQSAIDAGKFNFLSFELVI